MVYLDMAREPNARGPLLLLTRGEIDPASDHPEDKASLDWIRAKGLKLDHRLSVHGEVIAGYKTLAMAQKILSTLATSGRISIWVLSVHDGWKKAMDATECVVRREMRPERSFENFSRGAALLRDIRAMQAENKNLPVGSDDIIHARIDALRQEYDLTPSEWHGWAQHAQEN